MTQTPEIPPEKPVPRRRRRPTVAELELWRDVMRDVLPLRRRRRILESAPPETSQIPSVPASAAPSPRTPAPLTAAPALSPLSRELVVGRLADVDKRNAQRFRRGKMPIEARIDLHGMTQDRAHPILTGFLARAQEKGQRCVLVITGKGLRQDGAVGVLRSALPRWLNEAPNRDRVLGLTHATPADGGEGAYYVLLRRKR